MRFWYSEDELWPDIEVSTGRPVRTDRDGNEQPVPSWHESDAPPELVARYAELGEAFMASRDALLAHIEGREKASRT